MAVSGSVGGAQMFQYPLIAGYALHHIWDPTGF